MNNQNDQIAEYVDRIANLIELPIDPEYRPGVVANMTRSESISRKFSYFG